MSAVSRIVYRVARHSMAPSVVAVFLFFILYSFHHASVAVVDVYENANGVRMFGFTTNYYHQAAAGGGGGAVVDSAACCLLHSHAYAIHFH